MPPLSRVMLFCIVLTLPRLTLAQTFFDAASGTIQGNGVLATASWSGTFTINETANPTGNPTFTVSNWNISIPAILASNGTLSAFVFTPRDSTATAMIPAGSIDSCCTTFITFTDPQNQTELLLQVNGFNFGATNSVPDDYTFYQNGVQYVAAQGTGTLSPVPEPSSFILLATGLAGLVAFRRKLLRRVPTPHSQ